VGSTGESPYEAARSFCRVLCLKPRLPDKPVYGGNNWYYAYGENCSATALIHDAELIAELSPTGGVRPFMVMDDGWGTIKTTGPWDHGNDRFPDMADMAAGVRKLGVRPGIWFRPLYTAAPVPESSRLRPGSPAGRGGRRVTLDPSIPEVVEAVRADVRRLTGWGYEMLKHDFTSYDILARWGPTMGGVLTDRGWHFSDRGRTTAEIVLALYRAIREAAGDALVIGCNTFGHLGAGLFELQRTGDDVSGHDFHRTRLMGVNTLAFRGPQHGTFFAVDADCVPVTPMVDWSKNRLWLDLVAESGTALFVSADPRATGPEQKAALRQAFARASSAGPAAEPLDWMETTTPGRWRIDRRTKEYDWYGVEGSSPFAH
jgi:alpha-galactosidase